MMRCWEMELAVLELESPLPIVRRYRSLAVPLFLGFRKIPALAIDTANRNK